MSSRVRRRASLVLLATFYACWPSAQAMASEALGSRATGAVIPILGEITQETVYVFQAGMREAEKEGAEAVVLLLDTPGGQPAAVAAIASMMDQHEQTRFYAYVHGEQFGGAWSAGAVFAFCCERLYVRTGRFLGGTRITRTVPHGLFTVASPQADPQWLPQVRRLAKQNGYPPEVAEAMFNDQTELWVADVGGRKEFFTERPSAAAITSSKLLKQKDALLALEATAVEELGIGKAVAGAEEVGNAVRLRRPNLLHDDTYKTLSARQVASAAQRLGASAVASAEWNELIQHLAALGWRSGHAPPLARVSADAALTLGQRANRALFLCHDLVRGASQYPSLQLPDETLEALARELQDYLAKSGELYATATSRPTIEVLSCRWQRDESLVRVQGEVRNVGNQTAHFPRVAVTTWHRRLGSLMQAQALDRVRVHVEPYSIAPGGGGTFSWRFFDPDKRIKDVSAEVVDHGYVPGSLMILTPP